MRQLQSNPLRALGNMYARALKKCCEPSQPSKNRLESSKTQSFEVCNYFGFVNQKFSRQELGTEYFSALYLTAEFFAPARIGLRQTENTQKNRNIDGQ